MAVALFLLAHFSCSEYRVAVHQQTLPQYLYRWVNLAFCSIMSDVSGHMHITYYGPLPLVHGVKYQRWKSIKQTLVVPHQ